MAVERTGSVTEINSSAAASSQSITVPADCDYLVVAVTAYDNLASYHSGGTITLNGVSLAVIADADDNNTLPMATLWGLADPDTGSQTLAWDWAGSSAPDEGAIISAVYLKGVDSVRDGDGGQAGSGTAPLVDTGNLTIEDGDYVLAVLSWFSDSGGTSSWENATEFFNSGQFNFDTQALAEATPSDDVTIAGGDNPWGAAIAAAVFIPAATNPSTSLYPTADGTVTDVVDEGDATSSLFASIDDDPSSPNDADWNNNTDDAGQAFYQLTDMPSDFSEADSASIEVRHRGQAFTGPGIVTLFGRLYQSDESTALSDELQLAQVTADTSFANASPAALAGIVAGSKSVWDGARLRLRWERTNPAAAAPVVEGVSESVQTSASTSHPVTLPAGIVATDETIIIMDIGSTAATLNALAGWTELLDEAVANGLKILRYTGAGVPSAPTFVTSANTRSAQIAYRISGADKATTPQIGTTATGTSTTPNPPSVTPAGGVSKAYLSIAFYGAAGEEADDDTWSDTPPTNYTPSPPRQKSCGTAGTNLGGLIAAAERQITTGAAIDPGTFAKDVSAAWRAQHILVHPAPFATAPELQVSGLVIDLTYLATSEPELVAELAVENDIAVESTLRNARRFTVELAEGSHAATDAVLRAAQRFTTEQAAENNVGQDAVLRPALRLSGELASEQDAATEPTLEVAAAPFTLDQAIEQDAGSDAGLRPEPVFVVELAVENTTAADVVLRPATSMTVELATENYTAHDPQLQPAARFTAELATENDTGFDLTLGQAAELLVELASEADTALENLLRTEPVFTAELATTSDTADDIEAAVETGFTVHLATETASAGEATWFGDPVLTVELATERAQAADVSMAAEAEGPWWTPDPVDFDHDPPGHTRQPVVATRAPRPYTRAPVDYEPIT